MKFLHTTILFSFFFVACKQSDNAVKQSPAPGIIEYAKGFDLTIRDHSISLVVKNPWQNATGIKFTYVLSDTVEKSYQVSEFEWVIKSPVKKVVCLSTTHVGLLSFIDRTNTITGISGKNYVVNELVRKEIAKGNIVDVGYDEGLDYELIVKMNPDVVFAYGVSVSVTQTIRKLNELGIPVVLIGEYLESEPLGKTEWVKAVAAFYDLNDSASIRFKSVADRYTELSQLASDAGVRPEVLLGLPWRGSWYVSGAKSYIARLIHDAGGNYIWRDLDFNESKPMGLEKIYEKALVAEYWINPGEARTKKEILAVDPRFGNLPPLSNDQVYNNDNIMSPGGGNDIFETGVSEPDIILSDLISILHPHLLPSHKLKYYRKVN